MICFVTPGQKFRENIIDSGHTYKQVSYNVQLLDYLYTHSLIQLFIIKQKNYHIYNITNQNTCRIFSFQIQKALGLAFFLFSVSQESLLSYLPILLLHSINQYRFMKKRDLFPMNEMGLIFNKIVIFFLSLDLF